MGKFWHRKWLSWHWFLKGIDKTSLINLICFYNRYLSTRMPTLYLSSFLFLYFIPIIPCILECVGINNLQQNKGYNSRFKSGSSRQSPSHGTVMQSCTNHHSRSINTSCCFLSRNNWMIYIFYWLLNMTVSA